MNLLCVKNVKELDKVWNGTWESMQLVFPINEKYGSCLDELLVGISGPYTLQKILAKGRESPYEIHLHVDRSNRQFGRSTTKTTTVSWNMTRCRHDAGSEQDRVSK